MIDSFRLEIAIASPSFASLFPEKFQRGGRCCGQCSKVNVLLLLKSSLTPVFECAGLNAFVMEAWHNSKTYDFYTLLKESRW